MVTIGQALSLRVLPHRDLNRVDRLNAAVPRRVKKASRTALRTIDMNWETTLLAPEL